MKRLLNGHWSLIGKYLRDEASPADQVQLHNLFEQWPGLKEEILLLNSSVEKGPSSDVFDSQKAFQKLDERFKDENLI
jgi:hypothetical protein